MARAGSKVHFWFTQKSSHKTVTSGLDRWRLTEDHTFRSLVVCLFSTILYSQSHLIHRTLLVFFASSLTVSVYPFNVPAESPLTLHPQRDTFVWQEHVTTMICFRRTCLCTCGTRTRLIIHVCELSTKLDKLNAGVHLNKRTSPNLIRNSHKNISVSFHLYLKYPNILS